MDETNRHRHTASKLAESLALTSKLTARIRELAGEKAETAQLLQQCAVELRQSLFEIGCDHSVGICACHIARLAEACEKVLSREQPAEGGEES